MTPQSEPEPNVPDPRVHPAEDAGAESGESSQHPDREEALRYLDPAVAATIQGLELRALKVVEGFTAGMHRSPFQGFSVEFAQHRPYAAGDELRRLDWKVFARTDRLFLKQYEVETNMPVWLLLDRSASMAYQSPDRMSKYDYAGTAAAALALLALRQRDAVGLVSFDAGVRTLVRPANNPGHLRVLTEEIAAGRPEYPATQMGEVLAELADRVGRRGLLVLLSDLFDEPARLLTGLRRLNHHRHEIVVIHVLDPWERSFPFEEPTLFRGLEAGPPPTLADAAALAEAYRAELADFTDELARGCRELGIDFLPLDTGRSLGLPLAAYLASRNGRVRR